MVPGSALLIDDRLELIERLLKNSETSFENAEIEELNNLWNLILSLNRKGIPVTMFSSNDVNDFENLVKETQNIRLVILDLDIDGDGEVTEADEEVIKNFIRILKKEQGYFFLFIYSGHKEKWEDIKEELEEDQEFVNNMTLVFAKEEELENGIVKKIEKLSSLSVIHSFERELNKARDIVANKFIEFGNETWKSIISMQRKEVGDLWEYELLNLFLGLIRHNMRKSGIFPNFPDPSNNDYSYDMIKKIYNTLNYVSLSRSSGNVVFTGNLYETRDGDVDKKYALILTPECDIAQEKNKIDDEKIHIVVYGISTENMNRVSKKRGKSENKVVRELNDKQKLDKEYLYTLLFPFSSKNDHIILDFRFVETVKESIIKENWMPIARINEPMITDIMDKFSNYINRKGLPSLLPRGIKLIGEDESHS